MVNFKCPRCGEIFSRYNSYIRHTNKENPCLPTLNDVIPDGQNCIKIPNEIICEYCNNSFTDQFGLKRHKETCKNKNDPLIQLNQKIVYVMGELNDITEDIQGLREDIRYLVDKISKVYK
jgi:uncharacterized Zn-finger protein